ncbi:hypothetical protein A3762_01290 [Oleiphilus sp. HI0125]|uniref:DUF6776 family protein n=2 Tax=Oleiphilus sp. HI0125 TaxID=1822266 RepID=UPI0007C1FDBA|nr:DUF6776 family protein [Oleiphilus sp. HI0125]KZZ57284.1 hypothetical protein A3762_01290 [Oleiphilus sp. HI0125]
MAKHNPHEKMVLVRHEPGRKRKLIIQLICLVLVCASAAYYVGVFEMKQRHQVAVESLNALSEQYRLSVDENQGLKQKIANLEQSEAINLHAKQEIQSTIRGLREQVAGLQKDVSFYQNIMAPSDNNKGLQIQALELSALSENRHYAYKIVLAQLANNKRYLQGVVAVNLIGQRDSESVILPLRDVSEVEELGMKFRFRYFQEFAGELILPENFEPENIQVVAQSKEKSASRVERNVAWQELIPALTAAPSVAVLEE